MSTRKIIVTRPYAAGATIRQVREDAARAAASSRQRRQASYSLNRLVGTTPGTGRPLYATGRGSMGVGEVKFFDVDVANPAAGLLETASVAATVPTNAFVGITQLNSVLQGATSYNRIGAKILIKSVNVRGTFRLLGTAPVSEAFRFMIVFDRQPNGAYPSLASVLSDNISGATSFHSAINMSYKDRFVILRDQYRTLSPAGNTALVISEHIKTKLETQYKANAGTIGDISTGALYLICFALTAPGAASYIAMDDFHSRLRYFD